MTKAVTSYPTMIWGYLCHSSMGFSDDGDILTLSFKNHVPISANF